jgi:hypothetical protein
MAKAFGTMTEGRRWISLGTEFAAWTCVVLLSHIAVASNFSQIDALTGIVSAVFALLPLPFFVVSAFHEVIRVRWNHG